MIARHPPGGFQALRRPAAKEQSAPRAGRGAGRPETRSPSRPERPEPPPPALPRTGEVAWLLAAVRARALQQPVQAICLRARETGFPPRDRRGDGVAGRGPPKGPHFGLPRTAIMIHVFVSAQESHLSRSLIWSADCQPRSDLSPRCLRGSVRRGERIGCRDVCVATDMRGLVPHDRVCEIRSGAVFWRRAWPVRPAHRFSRVAPRVVAPVRSPRRAVAGTATSSSRAPSSVRRARGRRRPRPSSGACLGSRGRASVRGAGGRSDRLEFARLGACRCAAFEGDAHSRRAALVPGGFARSRRACELPVLSIPPWRRRSPLEFSLGVRPRNGPSASGGTCSSRRARRSTRTPSTSRRLGDRQPLHDINVRAVAASSAIASSSAPPRLRVQHPAVTLVEHDRERPGLEPLPAKPRVVRPRPGGRAYTAPWRRSSFESRWRARIRSPRASLRARTRSRAASSSRPGTRTGVTSPSRSSLANRSASRRSTSTRSAAARIRDGAATSS